MTNTARIVLAAIFFISAAFGQEDTNVGQDVGLMPEDGYNSELREALKLTDDQMDRLRKNVNAMFAEADPVAGNLFDKERELMRERMSDSPNEAIIGRTTVEVDKLRKQLEAIRDKYRASALAVLTAEQRKALVPIEEAAKRVHLAYQAAGVNLVTVQEDTAAALGSFGDPGIDEIEAGLNPGSNPDKDGGSGGN